MGASAAALAAALLIVNIDAAPQHTNADLVVAQPATTLPQRARLVRLDEPDRAQEREARASRTAPASILAPKRPLQGASAAMLLYGNVLALLTLGSLVMWRATRRRLALQAR